jgi:transketolase
MIGSAMGLAARGADSVPVDVCGVPRAGLRLHPHGVHQQREHQDRGLACGCVDRRGRPSQMALEDLAMMRAQPNMTVLYPCDAVSTERLLELMAYHPGPGLHATVAAEDAGDLCA